MYRCRKLVQGISVAIFTLLLAACQQMPIAKDSESFTQVTEAELPNHMGKKWDLNGDYIVVAEDGTFDGTWKNQPIAGTWEMKDGYWCRVLTVFFEPERTGSEDCQLIEANQTGDKLRGTRNRGKGISFVYAVK